MERLISAFSRLPGVGRKTAIRYAYFCINTKKEDVEEFANALIQAKNEVHYCKMCGNYTDKEICQICENGDKSLICVVAEPKDILALQNVTEYYGTYHVLHGLLSPLDNITPKDLNIKSLLTRIQKDNVSEVIIATNPSIEGEATSIYLSNLLKTLGVKVTRIAQGISLGTDIEYADALTLARAIEDRREI